jgi:hypothetical protein
MRLVNALCLFVEQAEPAEVAADGVVALDGGVGSGR